MASYSYIVLEQGEQFVPPDPEGGHSMKDELSDDLVNIYTARKLTEPNDRAHAIAGMA